MINSREIVDGYTREAHTVYEATKWQGLYCNSKYMCCLLLLATLFSYPDHQLLALSAEDSIPDLCELPEDISAFKALIKDKVGEEISGTDIELLQKEMEFVGENETIDYGYSRSEKVRYVFLRKECIAPDNIPYRFAVGVLTDLLGNAIFHQTFLLYQREDMLNGKRAFFFENVIDGQNNYAELISKNTVGVMNKKQLDEYMDSLSCSKLATDEQDSAKFLYKRDREKHLSSRMSGIDFSNEILVDFNAEGIVKKITVIIVGFKNILENYQNKRAE